jgi:hypothetical protein
MPTKDVSEMMLTLMKATGTYVYRRIENRARHREAYRLGMTKCIQEMTSGRDDIQSHRDVIVWQMGEVFTYYPNRFFFKNENQKYYIMACQNALEIIDRLEARFITGASDTDPRMFRDKNLFYYSNEEIFE